MLDERVCPKQARAGSGEEADGASGERGECRGPRVLLNPTRLRQAPDNCERSLCLCALQVLKKQGVFHIPYRGTMLGAALGGGREILRNPLRPGETMDERLEKKV